MEIWMLRMAGFMVGAVGAFAIKAGLLYLVNELFGARIIKPIGPLWLIIMIIAGVCAAKYAATFAPSPRLSKHELVSNFWRATPLTRFVIVAPIFWMLCVVVYVLVFEPYETYRMRSEHYIHMLKVILFPSAVLISGYFAYIKIILPGENTGVNMPTAESGAVIRSKEIENKGREADRRDLGAEDEDISEDNAVSGGGKSSGITLIVIYTAICGALRLIAGVYSAATIPAIISIPLIAIGIFALVAAYGLWSVQSWGRICAIWLYRIAILLGAILICFVLLNSRTVPVHTLLYLIDLWLAIVIVRYLSRSDIRALYEPRDGA